ncbi:hypothetical protein EXE53_20200 [Halorubrum sp. SD626R]|uniref:hypothetical protein n=1 Tax=Halorubrum TaxID=56688 RepID=UPI0010F9CA7B|nr:MULTISPECIES: hypothetical protein [Halorubrum]TKX78622.1 hypothetical protein EXE53_20200 [Halorubrum sp. SD626R]
MPRSFPLSRPLQAGKTVVTLGTLGFGGLGFARLVPDQQLTALLLVSFVGLCLALVVAVETLLAAVRVRRADEPMGDRLSADPAYTGARLLEAAVAILATVGFVAVFAVVSGGQMAGPGAVGLLFVFSGLGVTVLVTSLVRTLTEYVRHRRRGRRATETTDAVEG